MLRARARTAAAKPASRLLQKLPSFRLPVCEKIGNVDVCLEFGSLFFSEATLICFILKFIGSPGILVRKIEHENAFRQGSSKTPAGQVEHFSQKFRVGARLERGLGHAPSVLAPILTNRGSGTASRLLESNAFFRENCNYASVLTVNGRADSYAAMASSCCRI